MKKAIIIGASSGIGRALAKVLSENGYTLGLSARRVNLLSELQKELPNSSFIQEMDVTQTFKAMQQLEDLIQKMEGVELVIINAGVRYTNEHLGWQEELITLNTNVTGFAALANVALKHFIERKTGHLVGISSIASLRGTPRSPAYNASKAFESNYLEGLRLKAMKTKLPIFVTDIRPGLVDTDIIKDSLHFFWVASPGKAASQIFKAIQRKKKKVYITKRWRLVAWLMKILPDSLYAKGY